MKIEYRDDGSVLSEITVKGGWKHGLAVNYYPDGRIQNEINYMEGRKEGRATTYYESGALYRESYFVNGKLEGIQKRYYENGKLMAEVPWKNGELQPGTMEYTSEGNLKQMYPEIVFGTEDKLAFNSNYVLKMHLSKKHRNTKFYKITKVDGKEFRVTVNMEGDTGELFYTIRKGGSIMERIHIIAEFHTVLNNPMRIDKTYNLAVENR